MRIDRLPAAEDKEQTFHIIGDDGSKKDAVLLFTYLWEKTGKTYIAYLDDVDEEGALCVSALVLDDDRRKAVHPIQTREEYDMMADRIHDCWYES